MNIGIIAPIEYLEFSTTNFHICYSDLLSSKTYLDFYKAKSKSKKNTVILDLSPDLPRLKINNARLLEGLDIIKPTYIVLPSVDFSWERTVNLSNSFVDTYDDILSPKTIGVLQGVDLDSLAKCYSGLKDISDIIGLGSSLERLARREEIVRDLKITKPTIYLEVLSDPFEELPCTNCLGVCTSFPVRLAQDLRTLEEYRPTPPSLNFNIPKGKLLEDLVVRNIGDYISAVREGVRV